MESINEFSKGMDLDTNPLNLEQGRYKEANNIRIVNDVNSTSFSVNNIKGNAFNITIPSIPAFQKIEIINNLAAQTLTINGETGSAFNSTGMTPETLYNYINNDVAYTHLNVQYNIYYGSSYIVFVPIGAFTLTLSGTAALQINTPITSPTVYIPAQSGLEIIGSANIRGDIYLFTTSNKTKNPGGHDETLSVDPSSIGQIWKYTYDKITFTGILKLIYNNYIDFSTYYAIPPTGTTGRYESINTQRIYFTDFYNKLRSINVANPQSLALPVSDLDVRPAVDFDIPIMSSISSAVGTTAVTVGVWQLAYRLKNTGGATTSYSPLSNMINIVPYGEEKIDTGNEWINYFGAAGGTSITKAVDWKINNIDTNFERIEAVLVIRNVNNDIPTSIIQVYEGPIAADSITIHVDGSIIAAGTIITLTEFLALSGAFTHCKTIGTKDNRLFAANIKNKLSDITYDARAFRTFTSNTDNIWLTNNGVSTTDTFVNWKNTSINPETNDDINDYVNKPCFFKPGSTHLGGAGTNISYEFISIATSADKFSNLTDCVPAPFVRTDPMFSMTSPNLNVFSARKDGTEELQVYNKYYPGTTLDGIKFPPCSSIYVGYQHNEIYRFGIQFYNKSKDPFFVKWIGDIKFPDHNSTCPGANHMFEDGTATGQTTYNKVFTDNTKNNVIFVTQLGIQFTINIPPDISKLIDGYSIVRVKRNEKDKSIIAEGIISNFTNTGSPYFIDDITMPYFTVGGCDFTKPNFITPNMLDLSLTTPTQGMKFHTSSYLEPVNSTTAIHPVCDGNAPFYMYKLFNQVAITPEDVTINFSVFLTADLTYTVPAGTFNNFTADGAGRGNAGYYFELNSALAPGFIGAGNARKYFGYIYKPAVVQYGGATYTERSANTYILCSHYRKIKTSSIIISDSPFIYGGDVTNGIMDEQRLSKDPTNITTGHSSTFYYPASSPVNKELQHGLHINHELRDDLNTWNGRPTYQYNTVYSCQNDIVKFVPKPDPFIINEEFDNRFYASEIKINGEFTDSWGVFKVNNYWDVEGTYGPINAMDILKDKMYFWQNRAFGIIEINPRSIVTDINNSSNAKLQIGTGLPLQRHDYLSTEIGLQHQWGVTKSSYKLFWLDVNNKKFFAYGEGESISPESDIKGMFSYFNDNLKNNILTVDKPTYFDGSIGLNGVRCIYDFKYNQAIFTISDGLNREVPQNNSTFVFDERINAFTSFYSFTPKVYFGDGYKIFSTDNLNASSLSNIYMHDIGPHCSFYGVTNSNTIRLVVNPNFQFTKVFDNIMFDSQSTDSSNINYNDDTWNEIRIYNNYQNTDYQTLTLNTNIKRKERTWQMAIPRNRVLYTSSNSPNIFTDLSVGDKIMGERMRDKYIVVDLIYLNTTDRNLAFNNFRTSYRQSSR